MISKCEIHICLLERTCKNNQSKAEIDEKSILLIKTVRVVCRSAVLRSQLSILSCKESQPLHLGVRSRTPQPITYDKWKTLIFAPHGLQRHPTRGLQRPGRRLPGSTRNRRPASRPAVPHPHELPPAPHRSCLPHRCFICIVWGRNRPRHAAPRCRRPTSPSATPRHPVAMAKTGRSAPPPATPRHPVATPSPTERTVDATGDGGGGPTRAAAQRSTQSR